MKYLTILTLLILTGCQFHVVVKPPALPTHSPVVAPTVNLVPTVTPTP